MLNLDEIMLQTIEVTILTDCACKTAKCYRVGKD